MTEKHYIKKKLPLRLWTGRIWHTTE